MALAGATWSLVGIFYLLGGADASHTGVSKQIWFWLTVVGQALGFTGSALGIVGIYERHRFRVSSIAFVLNVFGLLGCIYCFWLSLKVVFPVS